MSEDTFFLIIVGFVFWLSFSVLGSYVAAAKHRQSGEGFILGLLFGIFGVIIEACLPTIEHQKTDRPRLDCGVQIRTDEEVKRMTQLINSMSHGKTTKR